MTTGDLSPLLQHHELNYSAMVLEYLGVMFTLTKYQQYTGNSALSWQLDNQRSVGTEFIMFSQFIEHLYLIYSQPNVAYKVV